MWTRGKKFVEKWEMNKWYIFKITMNQQLNFTCIKKPWIPWEKHICNWCFRGKSNIKQFTTYNAFGIITDQIWSWVRVPRQEFQWPLRRPPKHLLTYLKRCDCSNYFLKNVPAKKWCLQLPLKILSQSVIFCACGHCIICLWCISFFTKL